ncbi:putative 50S ribosome-binding GTPase [Lyophyllum shimeji]|uniref:50S ribosome-binding GTPase n=1 Tax=Lyophyllum shimeji TaxID=47721 RepID=A0A9P3PQ20_LYOSH|nr:putative 50S ribosome-binding GTPase [Lyophyllum shimeji]
MPSQAKRGDLQKAAAKDSFMEDGDSRDIVILVMGPSGAGKSTFVNAVLGEERMRVGHNLTSCTVQLQYAFIDSVHYQGLEGHRMVIVDTPGFDDTYEGDATILRRIAEWLENTYHKKKVVGGVIYLHDISQDRFSGTARRSLEVFNHLCGDAALSKVILGTTKWSRISADDGKRREEELIRVHWVTMIGKGSAVHRFQGDTESALGFISIVAHRTAMDNVLEIQKELALDRKIIPETKAGKELRYTLQEVLEMQRQAVALEAASAEGKDPEAKAKLDEMREQIGLIAKNVKDLKIPLARRILRMLGLI